MDEITITVEANLGKGENDTFEKLIASVYEMTMQLGRELVSQALEARDEELMKSRDRSRYRCKGKQPTSVKTRLGIIEYRRNVYVDKSVADGVKCVHLLDEELGIEKIGQIAKEVCEAAGELACVSSYREAAKTITENTGMSISAQGVWNVVQKLGEQRSKQVERHAELARRNQGVGCVESKLIYEENDGVWLKRQGKDRKECGPSKEMKAGIAYDGVTWQKCKGGKKRRTLDCKIASQLSGSQLYRDYRLLAMDGSDVQIPTDPTDMESYFPGIRGRKPFNITKIGALYDLLNHTYVDAIVKATPHNCCAQIAQSEISADGTKFRRPCCRMVKGFWDI